jgi:hypothetical protein
LYQKRKTKKSKQATRLKHKGSTREAEEDRCYCRVFFHLKTKISKISKPKKINQNRKNNKQQLQLTTISSNFQ